MNIILAARWVWTLLSTVDSNSVLLFSFKSFGALFALQRISSPSITHFCLLHKPFLKNRTDFCYIVEKETYNIPFPCGDLQMILFQSQSATNRNITYKLHVRVR